MILSLWLHLLLSKLQLACPGMRMCEHGVFLGCTHCVVNMRWFNLCQGCSSNTPFTHGVSRFLKQAYIFNQSSPCGTPYLVLSQPQLKLVFHTSMPITQILPVDKRELKQTSLREKLHYPKEKIH